MPYELSEKPVIKKRTLDDSKLILDIDLEKGVLCIEGILSTEYENEKNTITKERPCIRLRGDDCFVALNTVLPDNDSIMWTNPRKTFTNLLMKLLADNIQ